MNRRISSFPQFLGGIHSACHGARQNTAGMTDRGGGVHGQGEAATTGSDDGRSPPCSPRRALSPRSKPIASMPMAARTTGCESPLVRTQCRIRRLGHEGRPSRREPRSNRDTSRANNPAGPTAGAAVAAATTVITGPWRWFCASKAKIFSPNWSGRNREISKLPAAVVPPLPSCASSPAQSSGFPFGPTAQIFRLGAVMFGAACPDTCVDPAVAPPVITWQVPACWQVLLVPLQVSVVQAFPSSVQCVPFGFFASSGHA